MWYKLKRIMIRPQGVERQIRPSGWWGWQPWANTLAYYQFNDDLTDSSWNWNNFSWTPYWYDTWIEWDALQNYTPWGAVDLTANVAPLWWAFALAFWISLNNSQTLQRIFTFGSSNSTDIQFEFYNAFSGFQIYNNGNSARLAFPFTQPSVWDWHSFVITWDGVNQIEVYIDWTQVSPYVSYNPTFWYPLNSNIRIWVYGYGSYDNSIDELVIEDKHWSQTDVDAYLANYN